MKAIETIVTVPMVLSLLGSSQIVLRGRADAENILIRAGEGAEAIGFNPIIGLALLGGLLVTGSLLVAREMHVEAKEARKNREVD